MHVSPEVVWAVKEEVFATVVRRGGRKNSAPGRGRFCCSKRLDETSWSDEKSKNVFHFSSLHHEVSSRSYDVPPKPIKEVGAGRVEEVMTVKKEDWEAVGS